MKDLTTDKRVASALAVMTVDPKIRAFLEANDPKAANEDPEFDSTC